MRILIATDGSAQAQQTIKLAAFMASLAPCQVHLLGLEKDGHNLTHHLNQGLEALAEAGVVSQVTLKQGDSQANILELARKQNFELIVLAGDRQQSCFLQPDKLGQLLRHVNSHVLVGGTCPRLPRRILLPLGGSYQSRRAVRYISPLAKALGANVDLFHVMARYPVSVRSLDGQRDVSRLLRPGSALARSLEWQRRILADTGVQHGMIVRVGEVAESIADHCEESGSDLVVVGCQPTVGSLIGFFLGEITRKVITKVERPILLVRTTEAESGVWQNMRHALGKLVEKLG